MSAITGESVPVQRAPWRQGRASPKESYERVLPGHGAVPPNGAKCTQPPRRSTATAHSQHVRRADEAVAEREGHFDAVRRRVREIVPDQQIVVVALALAERMARQVSKGGLVAPSDFRNFMNRVLLYASEFEGERGS